MAFVSIDSLQSALERARDYGDASVREVARLVADALTETTTTAVEKVLPKSGWVAVQNSVAPYRNTLAFTGCTVRSLPLAMVDESSKDVSEKAGLRKSCESSMDELYFYADKIPSDDIRLQIALFKIV